MWGGVISEPFAARTDSGQVNLTGIFGVFTPGTLQATFYSVMGEELGHETLLAVDPREVVRLDKAVALPAQTYRISVSVRDANGENRGFLGNVILK